MGFLTSGEREILATLSDAFFPPLTARGNAPSLFSISSKDLDACRHVEQFLKLSLDAKQKKQFKKILRLVNSSLYCGWSGGYWGSFKTLSYEQRQGLLRAWEASSLDTVGKIFKTFKAAVLYVCYYCSSNGEGNLTWPFIGYSVQQAVIPNFMASKPIAPLEVEKDLFLECDVLVIGSGAGGGVVAGELSKGGLDVLVAEKGEYLSEGDFNSGNLWDLSKRLYERGGLFVTNDSNLSVLAGSALGGGTAINWTGAMRTPDRVLDEWENRFLFKEASLPSYQEIADEVSKRLNVNTDESRTENRNCAMFEESCQRLGYDVEAYPRNVKGCVDCSFCHWGCRYGAKQSTVKTYLQSAVDHGARILVNSFCQKILHAGGTATGALLECTDSEGKKHQVSVRAKAVVVSAGALHTPPLLLRSGLKNPHIGKHFRVHPGYAVWGFHDETINGWSGAPMTRICTDFMDLDGKGYGALILPAQHTPPILAAGIGWGSALEHRSRMLQFSRMSLIGAFARDYYGGEIKIDRQGNPRYYYKLHPYDERHLRKGVLEAVRLALASGAKEVATSMFPELIYRREEDLNRFLNHLRHAPIHSKSSLFTAHLMSSCRIAGSPSLGAVRTTGETYEIKKLYVADGSALPTATGVNPALSIFTLASYISRHINTIS